MSFDKAKGRLGFGCMRLPKDGDGVDTALFSRMVDEFLEAGYNYFDTAHGYMDTQSETSIRTALTSRYPRERYVLTDKLSGSCFKEEGEIRPFFESQLAACGVDYFDFYLMHAQGRDNYGKFTRCRAYEIVSELKREGKVGHLGISFHDSAEFLDKLLTEHPEIEVVQLQFNYADYPDPSVQSGRCYEVCRRHGKPVIVMEPVKGGLLADKLPPEGKELLSALGGGSPASYALRFAAGFEGVFMVLSGMSDLAQVRDNAAVMGELRPLDEAERAAVEQVGGMVRAQRLIPCTGCRYCVEGCPQGILIPDLFSCFNEKRRDPDYDGAADHAAATTGHGKASDCVKCGACEEICPQHLPVREWLHAVVRAFEEQGDV